MKAETAKQIAQDVQQAIQNDKRIMLTMFVGSNKFFYKSPTLTIEDEDSYQAVEILESLGLRMGSSTHPELHPANKRNWEVRCDFYVPSKDR